MKRGVALVITLAIILNMVAGMAYAATHEPPNNGQRWSDLMRAKFGTSLFRTIYIAAVLINVILLFAVLVIYISSYRKTKSSFTLGLVFFIGVLLLQRLLLFVFPLIPPFFETFALLILLMLSIE